MTEANYGPAGNCQIVNVLVLSWVSRKFLAQMNHVLECTANTIDAEQVAYCLTSV